MDSKYPCFSIVIPIYNKVEVLPSTLGSVLEQSFPDFEIVAVNDGSTDGSPDVFSRIVDERIRLFSIQNSGVSAARNYGIRQSKGEWVMVLDADDTLAPGALMTMRQAMCRFPDARMIVGNMKRTDGLSEEIYSEHYSPQMIENPFKAWFFRELMPRAGSFVCKREDMLRHPYKEYLRRSEDVEFLFNLFREVPVARIPQVIVVYQRQFSTESRKRPPIHEEFKGHLVLKGKSFWEKVCLYEYYIMAKNEYPEEARVLYAGISRSGFLALTYHALFWFRYLKHSIYGFC